VRARDVDLHLPIIMLSALDSPAQQHAGFVAGPDDYVTKPFGVEDLLDRVHTWMQTRRRLLRDAEARREAEQVRLQDPMDRKRTEQALAERESELRQSQKMEAIGRLAGGVAHDFNNLLTAISGYAELLLAELPAGDPKHEFADEIARAAERAAALTHQLLVFSRRQVLVPEVLDLNAVVGEMDKMLRRLIGEDVELDTALSPTLGQVRADRGQLEQVLLNLAVNARDAMPRGGRLTIETANVQALRSAAEPGVSLAPGAYVRLCVADTGQGMSPATQARVFEPFFTTKEPGRGTGLGLATVYGIVKQSEGHIAVDSEAGRGTAFRIYLPMVAARAPDLDRPSRLRGMPTGAETILLVEDEAAVRALTRTVLDSSGYTVLEASRPEEALRLSDEHAGPIHLLLTDVVLPGMSGRAISEQLTRRRPGVPVLYMSGYADHAIVRAGVFEPDVALLRKPFTPATLAQKVRQILDARRACA
jgi:signal transduction histidine kinase